MQMQNVKFSSTSSNIELMLEAFFCVQLAEHVKAWRWHQFTKNSNMADVDAALAKAGAQFREARNASFT